MPVKDALWKVINPCLSVTCDEKKGVSVAEELM
jgi:hypothetical protein